VHPWYLQSKQTRGPREQKVPWVRIPPDLCTAWSYTSMAYIAPMHHETHVVLFTAGCFGLADITSSLYLMSFAAPTYSSLCSLKELSLVSHSLKNTRKYFVSVHLQTKFPCKAIIEATCPSLLQPPITRNMQFVVRRTV